ncbi:MAG TPA: group III truncated hemoglobin [Flavipsychrobacter sp.]|nr:group III truncated hemoglobin [Flavipsychrobacter sp.]
MRRDIEKMDDIELLVNSFYQKVVEDDTIGYLFNDVAKVNWEKHLPVMYQFWQQIIFHTGNYSGNPMVAHQHLHRLSPLNAEHFNRWQELFVATVEELFDGENATIAKQRAVSIATVMRLKLLHNGMGKE